MRHILLDERDPERRLQQLQEAVGGYVEHVGMLELGAGVFANELGRILDLPLNKAASFLLDRAVVGDVVVLSAAEMPVFSAPSAAVH